MIFRRRYIIAAFALGTITAIGTAPWPINLLRIGEQLEQRFIANTGMHLTWKRATLTLLPSPRIELHQITVINPHSTNHTTDNALLRAPGAQVRLKRWPLVAGNLEPEHVTLNTPRIKWTEPEKTNDFQGILHHLLAILDNSSLPSHISIIDGLVLNKSGTNSILRQFNASVARPAKGAPLGLSATAIWRGEPIDLRIEKLLPGAITDRVSSPLSLRFSARPLSFTFNGQISAETSPVIAGDLSFSTRSFGRAVAWLEAPFSFADNAGRLAIKGTARLSNEGFSMPNAVIEVEGGTLEGALDAHFTETRRVLVSATLDTQKLDFDDLPALLKSPVSSSGWETAPLLDQTADIPNDLDIRLSASQVKIAKVALQDIAASLLVVGNKLEFSLNQARFNGGNIKARLQIAPSFNSITTRLTGTFEGIDTNVAIQNLFNSHFLSGKANGQIALEGIGPSPENIAQTLSGTFRAHITDGDIVGVDLANVLKRARLRPLATALDWHGGHSPFTEANASMHINTGVGELEGTIRFKDNLIGILGGSVEIADRILALHLHVNDSANTEMQGGQPIGFPFEISGPWNYPIVTPDIRLLIERLNATKAAPESAEPLLDN